MATDAASMIAGNIDENSLDEEMDDNGASLDEDEEEHAVGGGEEAEDSDSDDDDTESVAENDMSEEEDDRAQYTYSYLVSRIAASQAKSTIISNQKSPMAVGNQANSRLIALPPELQLRVFDLLDRCSSTCLGLSTRVFYRLHRAARGKVPLCAFYFVPGASDCGGFRLHVLLKEWAGPELQYCEIKDKFVTRTSLEMERIERAKLPENPCERICCHELDPVIAQKFVAIHWRDNREKRKDAREAGKASCWWA
ncbi:hypothetical protein N431DRAFT_463421 [Stipitochalara longipes BDJ]|nr:hypothetical protein N431DRAFT_463421 [Stipitochalara longipes BDJ]